VTGIGVASGFCEGIDVSLSLDLRSGRGPISGGWKCSEFRKAGLALRERFSALREGRLALHSKLSALRKTCSACRSKRSALGQTCSARRSKRSVLRETRLALR
jgi:hypothetical protein